MFAPHTQLPLVLWPSTPFSMTPEFETNPKGRIAGGYAASKQKIPHVLSKTITAPSIVPNSTPGVVTFPHPPRPPTPPPNPRPGPLTPRPPVPTPPPSPRHSLARMLKLAEFVLKGKLSSILRAFLSDYLLQSSILRISYPVAKLLHFLAPSLLSVPPVPATVESGMSIPPSPPAPTDRTHSSPTREPANLQAPRGTIIYGYGIRNSAASIFQRAAVGETNDTSPHTCPVEGTGQLPLRRARSQPYLILTHLGVARLLRYRRHH